MGRYGTRGQGSIYRYRDGWAGQIMVPRPDGTQVRRTRYGKTQRDVQIKLDELRRQVAGQAPDRLTVGAYLEEWLTVTLPQKVAGGHLAAGTVESYTDNARLHIIPVLGRHPLSRLSAPMIRAWLSLKSQETSRHGKPYAVKTLTLWHKILRAALSDAVRDDLLPRNVALLVESPTGAGRKVEPLSTDEARAVLAAAVTDRLRVLWLLLLALGLRRGEALALRWDAVDLDARTLTVRASLQRRRTGEVGPSGRNRTELREVQPKTRASAATLPLPSVLVEALAAHRTEQRRQRLAAPVWVEPGLVVAAEHGMPMDPAGVNRAWDELCARAGVRKCRPHDLRHTAASMLLAEGASMKTIQGMLRHAKMATTADVYTHVYEELSRDAADRMDGVLRRLGEQ